jgi:hypothetical protein
LKPTDGSDVGSKLGNEFMHKRKQKPLEPWIDVMLWSQFFATFDNFRGKLGVFLENHCYSLHNSTLFLVKNAILLPNFFAKIFF